MSKRIWEINTDRGFVCCVGYTTKQAIELILQKIMLEEDELNKKQEQKRMEKRRRMVRIN